MSNTKTKSMEHFWLPDTQIKKGVPINHLEAAGNYIVERQPDVIINAGDWFDMPSLSSYDKGTKKIEGARYEEDIEAGIIGMETFMKPINEYNALRARNRKKQYKPRMVFLIGNHEERIQRHVNHNPHLEGKLGYEDLKLKEFGWEVHDFLDPVNIDGVTYSHYFYNPNTGRPLGGVASTRLKNIGFSFTMGHQQTLDVAIRPLNDGATMRGLIAGAFYQHDEDYKGPQGNRHWRGCIYKHHVRNGNYDLMELSLPYLLKKWI